MLENTLSLCMIVKNEEEVIQTCLESVRNIVDEIIVVDTGSIDKTVQIAKEYNAKVYSFTWNGDFSAARNFSMEKATSEYILILDADEYLENDSNIKKEMESQQDYYLVDIKNEMGNNLVMWHQAIRLFKNKINLEYKGKIHEHLNVSEFQGLKSTRLISVINHKGYRDDIYRKKNKNKRNMEILEQEVKQNPSGYNYFNLANQYKAGLQFEKALEFYKKSFYLSKDKTYLSWLLNQMGTCLQLLKRYEEGIKFLRDAISVFPSYTDLYFTLGEHYLLLGQTRDAERCFLKCLELGEVKDAQTIEGVGSYLAFLSLSKIYEKRGELVKALEYAFKSLKSNKSYLKSLIQYIKVLRMGNISQNDIFTNLNSFYQIKNGHDLNNLLSSLYTMKSPLLYQYKVKFDLTLDSELDIISLQYGGKINEAFSKWENVEDVSKIVIEDIISISFVNKNSLLLSKLTGYFNKNEIKMIEKLVEKKELLNKGHGKNLEGILIKVVSNISLMGDRDTLKYLCNILTEENRKHNPELIHVLIDNGFHDLAMQILVETIQTTGTSKEYLEMLGHLNLRLGKFQDAYSYYGELFEKYNDYPTYERLYNLFEKMNDQNMILTLRNEITEKFPLCNWVKGEAAGL